MRSSSSPSPSAILTVTSRHEPFTDIDNKYIRLLAFYLVDRIAAILLQKRTVELLYAKATRDSLTGILNRGAILEHLERVLAKAKPAGDPVATVIVDIDHFKVINDNYGHQTGDQVLCEVARRLQAAIRGSDHVGRYGGEEFLIVLGGCNREQAALASERVHRAIADAPFSTVGLAPIQIKVTISAGTASLSGARDGRGPRAPATGARDPGLARTQVVPLFRRDGGVGPLIVGSGGLPGGE